MYKHVTFEPLLVVVSLAKLLPHKKENGDSLTTSGSCAQLILTRSHPEMPRVQLICITKNY